MYSTPYIFAFGSLHLTLENDVSVGITNDTIRGYVYGTSHIIGNTVSGVVNHQIVEQISGVLSTYPNMGPGQRSHGVLM